MTVDELKNLDLANLTDENIAEIQSEIENISEKSVMREMIVTLLDRFELSNEQYVSESNSEQSKKADDNIRKILSSSTIISTELDIMLKNEEL